MVYLGSWQNRSSGSHTITSKFKNVGSKPVKAFRGRMMLINDFKEISEVGSIEYTGGTKFILSKNETEVRHVIMPNEVIYITKINFDLAETAKWASAQNHYINMLSPKNPGVEEADLGEFAVNHEKVKFKFKDVIFED